VVSHNCYVLYRYLNCVSVFVLSGRQTQRIAFQTRVEIVAKDIETNQSCINIQACDSQCMVMANGYKRDRISYVSVKMINWNVVR
jgi:hypothetical protein